MPSMLSYPRRLPSGHFTCYLNRTYHVLPTRQKLLGNNVCENQVVPCIRRVHQERPSWRENAGHLLKHRRWLRQMLQHHVAGDQIEAGVWEGQRDQGCADPPEDINVLSQVKKIKIDANH